MKITKRVYKSDMGVLPDEYAHTQSKTASQAPGSLIGVKDKDDQSGTRPTPQDSRLCRGVVCAAPRRFKRMGESRRLASTGFYGRRGLRNTREGLRLPKNKGTGTMAGPPNRPH